MTAWLRRRRAFLAALAALAAFVAVGVSSWALASQAEAAPRSDAVARMHEQSVRAVLCGGTVDYCVVVYLPWVRRAGQGSRWLP